MASEKVIHNHVAVLHRAGLFGLRLQARIDTCGGGGVMCAKGRGGGHQIFWSNRQALWPPKPNELDAARWIRIGRAASGT